MNLGDMIVSFCLGHKMQCTECAKSNHCLANPTLARVTDLQYEGADTQTSSCIPTVQCGQSFATRRVSCCWILIKLRVSELSAVQVLAG